MNHSSNEVKQLLAQTVNFLVKSSEKTLPNNLVKAIIPQLVNGTKEKNTIVKANSEYALVAVLKLREDDTNVQVSLALLFWSVSFYKVMANQIYHKIQYDIKRGGILNINKFFTIVTIKMR